MTWKVSRHISHKESHTVNMLALTCELFTRLWAVDQVNKSSVLKSHCGTKQKRDNIVSSVITRLRLYLAEIDCKFSVGSCVYNNGTLVTCAHIATNLRLEPAAGCACTESTLAGNQIKLSKKRSNRKRSSFFNDTVSWILMPRPSLQSSKKGNTC